MCSIMCIIDDDDDDDDDAATCADQLQETCYMITLENNKHPERMVFIFSDLWKHES